MRIKNVSALASRFLKAKPGSSFVVPSDTDVPVALCRKFGVRLYVDKIVGEPFKVVKRI